jgi:GT2 family glycosyltransferase
MNKRKLPPFYIVTVNYYLANYLVKFISSLSSLTFVNKLIVVNHSPDETLENLSAPFPIHIINQNNRGYAYGLNRGLREVHSKNAIILLCNPDIFLLTPKELERALIYMHNHTKVGILVPQLVGNEKKSLFSYRTFYSIKTLLISRIGTLHNVFSKAYQEHLYIGYEQQLEPFDVDWGHGAALLYRFSALGRYPTFDENYFLYFEDVDLCARLWIEGFSVMSYPKLIFSHSWQRQSHKNWRFLYYHVASFLKFVRKFKGLPQRTNLLKRRLYS